MQVFFRFPPSRDHILKPLIAAQVRSFALEADGGTPFPLSSPPVYAGYAAGIIPAHSTRPEQFDTSAVYVIQPLLNALRA